MIQKTDLLSSCGRGQTPAALRPLFFASLRYKNCSRTECGRIYKMALYRPDGSGYNENRLALRAVCRFPSGTADRLSPVCPFICMRRRGFTFFGFLLSFVHLWDIRQEGRFPDMDARPHRRTTAVRMRCPRSSGNMPIWSAASPLRRPTGALKPRITARRG